LRIQQREREKKKDLKVCQMNKGFREFNAEDCKATDLNAWTLQTLNRVIEDLTLEKESSVYTSEISSQDKRS
jgi:hypothetical protein